MKLSTFFLPRCAMLLMASLTSFADVSAQSETSQSDVALKRLRDTLRGTMVQLQASEAERAALQAKVVDAEAELKQLKERNAALLKQLDAEKASASKTAAELDGKIANQAQELASTQEALGKWKTGYQQAAQVANATEAKRSQLAGKAILLQRKVEDQTRKNREMYLLGLEILDRYEKFGLGTALVRREPFTGIARVKFENLVQDYQDKLDDTRIQPDDARKPSPAAAAAGPASAPATEAAAAKPASAEKEKEKGKAPAKGKP